MADAGIVMVPAAEGLSRWRGRLRKTGKIGRGILWGLKAWAR
jgi:hypothetical protein